MLWKIYRLPNDLRSMHMLGANLTLIQRYIVGCWCRDNKIGFHKLSKDKKSAIGHKSFNKAIQDQNQFWWWQTEEGLKERASIGGKASYKSGNNTKFNYWCSEEGIKQRGYLGSQMHIGKKAMYHPDRPGFNRVPPNKIQEYLDNGWIFGNNKSGIKKKPTNLPAHNRVKVTDGITIFDSIKDAAGYYNLSSAAIIYKIKANTKKTSNWKYV